MVSALKDAAACLTICFCFNSRDHRELKERKETLEVLACR